MNKNLMRWYRWSCGAQVFQFLQSYWIYLIVFLNLSIYRIVAFKGQIGSTFLRLHQLKRSFGFFFDGSFCLNSCRMKHSPMKNKFIPNLCLRFSRKKRIRNWLKFRQGKWRRMLQDVLVLWPQWLVMAVILAAHGFITFFLPVPNCPT